MMGGMPIRAAALYIYPIKACRGIAVPRAEVAERGFRRDRRWMIVDAGGVFVTQRQRPSLALVSVALDGDRVGERMVVSAPDLDPLELPAEHEAGAPRPVQVWRHRGQGLRHDEGSAWFSRYLGGDHQLVYMPESHRRRVDPQHGRRGDVVSFADGYPFLLTTQESLDDLNRRLSAPVGMERFRPNIVVAGGAPFAEDGWSKLAIGPVGFRVAKPCERCVVTTVDPSTGKPGREPLRTLATFRADGARVLFGVNLVHEGTGTITVGDAVAVA
jgi:uncharacterized protein YcbX